MTSRTLGPKQLSSPRAGRIGWFALLVAAAGVLCVALPSPGLFFAMGLGIFAVATGVVGYLRRDAAGAARLAGAGGIAIGLLALALSVTKYGLTLAALRRLENLL